MKSIEFVNKVNNKKIQNGTKFEVLNDKEVIGLIGVIDTTIVYLDFPDIPVDLLTGEYEFIEFKEQLNK